MEEEDVDNEKLKKEIEFYVRGFRSAWVSWACCLLLVALSSLDGGEPGARCAGLGALGLLVLRRRRSSPGPLKETGPPAPLMRPRPPVGRPAP